MLYKVKMTESWYMTLIINSLTTLYIWKRENYAHSFTLYKGWITELTHWGTIKLSSEKMVLRIIKEIINWPMAFTPHEQLAMRFHVDAKNSQTKFILIERNNVL